MEALKQTIAKSIFFESNKCCVRASEMISKIERVIKILQETGETIVLFTDGSILSITSTTLRIFK